MQILVDTSLWVDYFRSGNNSSDLDLLIDENLISTNDIILAELVPILKIRKQEKVVKLLYEIDKLPLNINWDEIIQFQENCLKAGANGIPDLIIAQNARDNNCAIYSLDKHFLMLEKVLKLKLYDIEDQP